MILLLYITTLASADYIQNNFLILRLLFFGGDIYKGNKRFNSITLLTF